MPRGLIPEAFVQQSELVVWNDGMTSTYKHDGCAICHEPFSASVPDICRVLDCSHVFHAKCVDLWFIKATFCPLCKSDLKLTFRTTSSQRSLGRLSETSSQMSLGDRSHSSSLRSGQILVGHSNSDPALLRILQENPHTLGLAHMGLTHRTSPPMTPDRQYGSTASLPASLSISFSDRSLPVMGSSRSERSLGILSSSSSGALPAVQELSDEGRFASGSQRSSSNPPSPRSQASPGGFRPPGEDGGSSSEAQLSAVQDNLWPVLEDSCDGDTSTGALSSQLDNIGQSMAESSTDEVASVQETQSGGSSSTGAPSEDQRRALFASRNNSWITNVNSRRNVGHRAARKGNGVPAASAAGTPPPPPGSIAAASSAWMAVPEDATHGGPVVNPPQTHSSMRHRTSSVPPQEQQGPVSTPPFKVGTPPSSVASVSSTPPASTTCLPIAQSTGAPANSTSPSAATSASHLQGLATPPSVGVAATNGNGAAPAAAGQAPRSPYIGFAGTVGRGNATGTLRPTAHVAYPGMLGPAASVAQQWAANVPMLLGHQSRTSLQ